MQKLGEHLLKFREVFHAVAYNRVTDGPIDRQILVLENGPKADHGNPALLQR